MAVAEAKRGKEVAIRYPRKLKINSLCVGAAVDAGHANGEGTDEVEAYKSCGGYVVMLADEGIIEDRSVPMAVLDWKSGMTQRVCRSTLAAEASHLANAVEIVDWTAVFLQEILRIRVDLRDWQMEAGRVKRFWATDCKSVYDYLTKDGTGTSKDKRMAIEGALLKEVLRQKGATLRWVDGSQNIADVLTKLGVDKAYLYKVMRDARWSLVQDQAASRAKAAKAEKRSTNRKEKGEQKDKKVQQQQQRKRAVEMKEFS